MSGKSNGKRLKNIEAYQFLANTFQRAKNVRNFVTQLINPKSARTTRTNN
jgi:hypothetical protein